MNRKLVSSIINKTEGVRLDYFLLSTDREDFSGHFSTEYGIEIRQSPSDVFSVCPYLVSSVPDISCCKKDIEILIAELYVSHTDPSCLTEIIEDFIDCYPDKNSF